MDAFHDPDPDPDHAVATPNVRTRARPVQSTPYPTHTFETPLRPSATPHTFPRGSTVRRSTVMRRTVSDREAMKQLVDCVGMSARKKVMESGRKLRVLTLPLAGRSGMRGLTKLKDVRFGDESGGGEELDGGDVDREATTTMTQVIEYPAEHTYSESEGPPSPSPSPRPGSAMSMLSRRSVTPTISASYSNPRLAVGMTPTTSSSSNTLSVFPVPPTPSVRFPRVGKEDMTFTAGTFDVMEEKHAYMMEDIEGLERRLAQLLAQVD